MPTKFELAIKRNPHLGDYVNRYREKKGRMPDFYEQLTRDMALLPKIDMIYPVGDPVFIHIYKTPDGPLLYNVIEPIIEGAYKEKYDILMEAVFDNIVREEYCDTEEKMSMAIDKIMKGSTKITEKAASGRMFGKIQLSQHEYDVLSYAIKRNIISIGPIEPIIRDPYLEDIHTIGSGNVAIVHKVFGSVMTNVKFENAEELDKYVQVLGDKIRKPITVAKPIVDSVMPDGSRLNIIYASDVSVKGPSFTIRKFTPEPISFPQLVAWNTMSAQLAAYIWLCLEHGLSVFICGETASGKTTTLNAIATMIDHDSKIYSVEDTSEVVLPHRIWQQLLTRETGNKETAVDTFTLLKASLRSRPDYIIVGEIRGPEGNIAFQAMQAGRSVISTFHASALDKMMQRLTAHPIDVPVRFLDNLNLVIFQQAVYIGGRMQRRVTAVAELVGYLKEADALMSREVFRWQPATDSHRFRGMMNSHNLENIIAKRLGYEKKSQIYEDLALRTKIIEILVGQKMFGYHDIVEIVRLFQRYGTKALPFSV